MEHWRGWSNVITTESVCESNPAKSHLHVVWMWNAQWCQKENGATYCTKTHTQTHTTHHVFSLGIYVTVINNDFQATSFITHWVIRPNRWAPLLPVLSPLLSALLISSCFLPLQPSFIFNCLDKQSAWSTRGSLAFPHPRLPSCQIHPASLTGPFFSTLFPTFNSLSPEMLLVSPTRQRTFPPFIYLSLSSFTSSQLFAL